MVYDSLIVNGLIVREQSTTNILGVDWWYGCLITNVGVPYGDDECIHHFELIFQLVHA